MPLQKRRWKPFRMLSSNSPFTPVGIAQQQHVRRNALHRLLLGSVVLHCEPTLDAVVNVVPAERLLILNLESNEDWSDMNYLEKDKMESELDVVEIDHPFIHAPPLADTLGVDEVNPTRLFFVNGDGLIEQRLGLASTPNPPSRSIGQVSNDAES